MTFTDNIYDIRALCLSVYYKIGSIAAYKLIMLILREKNLRQRKI